MEYTIYQKNAKWAFCIFLFLKFLKACMGDAEIITRAALSKTLKIFVSVFIYKYTTRAVDMFLSV